MIDTIPALLHEAAKRFGDKPALACPNDPPMGFAPLNAMADAFAKALIGDGMTAGERVGIWAPNMWEWVAAAVGAQRVGGVMVPLYARYRAMEVADIVERARVGYLVCTPDLAELLRMESVPTLKRVVVLRADGAKLMGLEEGWQAFLARGESVADEILRRREAKITGDTISDIMFTSGTTGRPKGAVFNHRSAVRAGEVMRGYAALTEADCFCPMGTFAHVGGYKQGWVTGLTSGAAICWGDAFDAETVVDLVSQLGITAMPAPPVIWQAVLDHPDRGKWSIPTLRFIATGGTMVPADLVRRLMSEMNIKQVGTGYGMTETCGMANYTRPNDAPEKVANTVGIAAPDTEVRIIGPDGAPLGPEQTGEILVRNSRLMIEYLDDADATKAAIDADGWLHTGDVGHIDSDGYLTITDRLKDMYITNGFNVYPAEIERLMATMPGVAQCAVIGVPHPTRGEVGQAFIVSSASARLTEDNVVAWCKEHFASYKAPRLITFVDQLPRNVMGKVLKSELRQMMTPGVVGN